MLFHLHETYIFKCCIVNLFFTIIWVSIVCVFDAQTRNLSKSRYHQYMLWQIHQEIHVTCYWCNAETYWIHSSNQKTSWVVQTVFILFRMQYTSHHFYVYEFDWTCEWYQASWNIMSLRVDSMFLKFRRLSINFKSWLHSELDNQCRNIVLCLISS